MITPDYCRLMTRYNTRQNTALLAVVDRLSPRSRWQDRGAFFGSIAATLNHIYWGDVLWLARLTGAAPPPIRTSPKFEAPSDWAEYADLRRDTDQRLERWAAALDRDAMHGEVSWRAGSAAQLFVKPRAMCIAGLFHHQTHHRGQVHHMLADAGVAPPAADLIGSGAGS